MSHIEITTNLHEDGLREVKRVDAPDTLAEVPVVDLLDGVIMAVAREEISEEALATLLSGEDVATKPDEVHRLAELLVSQCEALDDLEEWRLRNSYRLSDAQAKEWHNAKTDGMYDRNPYDGEWQAAVNTLTELREAWRNAD